MKSRIHIIIVFALALCMSCKSQEKVLENKLQECVNQRINKSDYKIDNSLGDIDYYKIVSEIENYFVSRGIGKNASKTEYLKMIDTIINLKEEEHKSLYNDILSIVEKNNFNDLNVSSDVLQNCPHFILESEKNLTISLRQQIDAMDKLFALDPYNQDYINELVKQVSEEDFKRLVYRAPVVTILFEFLEVKSQK